MSADRGSEGRGVVLSARETMAVRYALVFGDPANAGYPSPELESAKEKLRLAQPTPDPKEAGS